ncbi:MAG: HAMP domain-containing sensor histidine kinase [Gemmatimonadota bacterium]
MRTIRTQLTVWYAVALLFSVLAFGVTISFVQRDVNYRQLERRLAAEADLAAALIVQAYQAGSPLIEEGVDPLVGLLRMDVAEKLEPIKEYVMVVDSSARRIFWSAEVQRLTPEASDLLRERTFAVTGATDGPHEVFSLTLDRVRVRFVGRRVRDAGPAIIAVAVGTPTSDVEIAPARLAASMLVVLPFIIFAALAVGWVLASWALRPVGQMIDELEAITDGRSLHRRLPAPGGQPDELGRLANTLNAMMARLEASFAALRRFIADASHELKTPLTVMRAGVERALTDPRTAAEALVPLEETLQEVRRMTELVDALLTLARVDEGRMELHKEPLDLQDLVAEVYETAQMLGEEAGLTVTLETPDEPVTAEVDAGRIRQLVMNLMTNAVKYTPSGGGIWLSLSATSQVATVAVRDSGIGIAPGDVGRVFDRFWRADAARSRTGERPGIGLGLAIGKWIAEAHGGSLAVTSRPGRGTTFTVTIPRSEPPQAAVIESSS